jgi:hypothetical protein
MNLNLFLAAEKFRDDLWLSCYPTFLKGKTECTQ